ncbi:Zinc finger protein JAGGED [Sesamum angolense]|uniref:Zinc finger protein JAGGED n=1 Tax=Sesamum angolense TaxID=2727404 RepID=A0AAE1WUJ3_9LAMI|nr:Zinc finger protein JAGGED [Sesamum angolense]
MYVLRPEGNPLDLNNFPEDYTRDGIQASEDSSSSAERETETLNKARQLVFTNDLAPAHLGYVSSGQPIPHGGYHQVSSNMCPTRMFSTSPLIPSPPPPSATYMYPSPPHVLSFSQHPAAPSVNDYFLGHVLSNSSYGAAPNEGNYTCIGAPVNCGSGRVFGGGGDGGGVRDVALENPVEGFNWSRR